MVSVKRFVQWFSLLLVILYVGVIVLDNLVLRANEKFAFHNLQRETLAKNGKNVRGLIIGGSNAMYGLSAKEMSQQVGVRFHNLALEQEGRSEQAYSDYLQTTADTFLEPEKIGLVVYSSLSSLRKGNVDLYENSKQSLTGMLPFSIKPRTDVTRLIKQMTSTMFSQGGLVPDTFGDLDFRSEPCDEPVTDAAVETEDLNKIIPFFQARVRFLQNLFPNANILVVVPSEFYAGAALPVGWKQALVEKMAAAGLTNTELVIQEPLPKVQWVCEVRHHPNAPGRTWRTSALLQSLEDTSIGQPRLAGIGLGNETRRSPENRYAENR